MKKASLLVAAAFAVGVSAQQPPAPPPSVSNFFNDFTAECLCRYVFDLNLGTHLILQLDLCKMRVVQCRNACK